MRNSPTIREMQQIAEVQRILLQYRNPIGGLFLMDYLG